MYCSHCGKEINDEAVFCVHCGVPVKPLEASAPAKQVDGLGLAGMIVGIVGAIGGNILFCMFSVIGLVLSIVAYVQGKKQSKDLSYAIAGIVVGAVGLAVWLGIWIKALAFPS